MLLCSLVTVPVSLKLGLVEVLLETGRQKERVKGKDEKLRNEANLLYLLIENHIASGCFHDFTMPF